MASGDLVPLGAVKAWLGVTTNNDDALLSALITQISRAIYNYTNRAFVLPRNVMETYDGLGRARLLLRNWPVSQVSAINIDGRLLPPSPGLLVLPLDWGQVSAPLAVQKSFGPTAAAGWRLEPSDDQPPGAMQAISLQGGAIFPKGFQNIAVAYRAGYEILDEAQSVPNGSPYQILALAPYGVWALDTGVKYGSGVVLTPVAAGQTPAQGQYGVDPTSGTYSFAAADAGATILLSYGYIPADLTQCALEWVAERYRYKDRIGMSSKSLGGQETASYRLSAMPDFVKAALQNFCRVLAN